MWIGGRQGDNVTTTGGPEHYLADPAQGSESATDPVVLDDQHEPLDGDDIVVEPHGAPEHPRRRHRELIVGIVALAVIAAGVGIALAARHSSGGNTHVTSSAPVRPPTGHPADGKSTPVNRQHVKTKPTTPATATHVKIAPTTPAVVPTGTPVSAQSPGSVGNPAATSATTPPTAPPATMPPSEPPSVLTWNAAPSTLSLQAGAHAVLTITVVNPTAGTVTLPHPISCPPALTPLHGPALGGMVCAEMAQIMAPHSKIVQHYTIYATDTGDASGAPLSAGQYLANVENLHNVKVTVTSN